MERNYKRRTLRRRCSIFGSYENNLPFVTECSRQLVMVISESLSAFSSKSVSFLFSTSLPIMPASFDCWEK